MDERVLLFDVNETLLDVRAMAPRFEAAVGDAGLLPVWFGLLLRYSLEVSVIADYRPFDELAANALETALRGAGRSVEPHAIDTVVAAMTELPAHPDVAPALQRLTAAGFRLSTLTNSRSAVVRDQLAFAGIDHHFDHMLSVEDVRRFKPHPATYAHAASALGAPIDQLTLVAAHDWDVNGALAAGAAAAFVERPSATRAAHNTIPDIVGPDLGAVADQLIESIAHD